IRNGVPVKGMIAWKTILRPSEIHQVASYVLSLQGTHPPNAKAPEGRKVTGE
ncbi:MAG: cytochrome oxidase subunit III, partial [candidate division KSB1 bacterium]|nr:cytochrome oxidase subunit III [candidate division KSB1 bacterium]